MSRIKHIWFTPDSADGQRTLKQHAYYDIVRIRPITGEAYQSNRAACSARHSLSKEGPEDVQIEEMNGEIHQPDNMCKICAKMMGVKLWNP